MSNLQLDLKRNKTVGAPAILFRATTIVAVVLAAALSMLRPAAACDICSVYTTVAMDQASIGVWAGLAEQFSSLRTVRHDGEKVANQSREMLRSSITQLILGYNFDSRWGVQLNLPWIERRFRQATGGGSTTGRERGLGDAALLARWVALDGVGPGNTLVRATLRAGVKLPTGDSDRLAEAHGHGQESALHGHDLALGTGAIDFLAGGGLFASKKRNFVSASLDYTLRAEGDHDYRHADDLTVAAGLGRFLSPGGGEHRAALELLGTVQTKGQDRRGGVKVAGSALTAVYLGPRLLYSWRMSLAAELALEQPVLRNNSGTSLVPDHRLRAAVTWVF